MMFAHLIMSAQQVDSPPESTLQIIPLLPLEIASPLLSLVKSALVNFDPADPLPLIRYEIARGPPPLLTLRLLCRQEEAASWTRIIQGWLPQATAGFFLTFALENAPSDPLFFRQDSVALASEAELADLCRQIDAFPSIPEHKEIASPLFMPRNEEEQMRNLLALSGQIRFVRDLPQAIIQYDSQRLSELAFTVLIVRLLRTLGPSLRELIEVFPLRNSVEEVRKLGTLKGKYPKEAATLRVYVDKAPYLRPDGRIDLPRARHAVVEALRSTLGKYRDFNGGLLEKQQEALLSLKKILKPANPKQTLEVENFFYSIRPGLMRTVLASETLAALYRFGEGAPSPSCKWEGDEIFAHLPPQPSLPSDVTTAQRGECMLVYLRAASVDSESARHIVELTGHLASPLVHKL